MQWFNILLTEFIVIAGIMLGLGFIKLPKFFRKRILQKGFPWGYYPDAVPKADPGFFSEHDHDFMHDVGTSFGGMEGFGEYGEFTGFGEMGEFGSDFSSGHHGGE
jgi:hypothetical protein